MNSDEPPLVTFRQLGAALPAALLLALPAAASAQTIDLGVVTAGTSQIGWDLPTVVTSLIRLTLAVAALLMIMKMVEGVFLMATHGGSEDAREEAIEQLKGAVVGLAVTATSAALTHVIVFFVIGLAYSYNLI